MKTAKQHTAPLLGHYEARIIGPSDATEVLRSLLEALGFKVVKPQRKRKKK